MIMVGAGTAVAPLRGFLQERATMAEQGVPVGKSMLFYGCRYATVTSLRDELEAFEASGVTKVRWRSHGSPDSLEVRPTSDRARA